ncbi:MAG TPA: ROK family protein, partial [Acidobacteriaceae bacterium]|nr:ROK family protein [Acidobacteriaceae bacterium]
MANTIGVILAERIVAGVSEDHRLLNGLKEFPENLDDTNGLIEIPADNLCEIICDAIAALAPSAKNVEAAGVALPGFVHQGVMLDSPNLPQLKGAHICESIKAGLDRRGLGVKVRVFNDADAVAAGIAATRGQMEKSVRVWTIGTGIGFGRYPWTEGP